MGAFAYVCLLIAGWTNPVFLTTVALDLLGLQQRFCAEELRRRDDSIQLGVRLLLPARLPARGPFPVGHRDGSRSVL